MGADSLTYDTSGLATRLETEIFGQHFRAIWWSRPRYFLARGCKLRRPGGEDQVAKNSCDVWLSCSSFAHDRGQISSRGKPGGRRETRDGKPGDGKPGDRRNVPPSFVEQV